MRTRGVISSIVFISSISFASAVSDDRKVHNANHIFNAIHSSMRQWGSSLNHNGMSVFMASVPAGTQLYHGTSKSEPIKGMEWLAFEPEHALIFARSRGPPGRRPPAEHDDQPPSDEEPDRFDEQYSHVHEPDHCPPPPPSGHHPHEPPIHHGPPPLPHDQPPPPPPEYYHEPPPNHSPPLPPPPIEPHHGVPPPPPPPGRPHGGPPPFPDSPHDGPPALFGLPHEPPKHHVPPPYRPHRKDSLPPHKRDRQQPLRVPTSEESRSSGFLHTYVPTHALNLLYIDGMSAGKTSNGTLDTQDILLLNLSISDPHHAPMMGEIARAEGLCNLTKTLWEGKIDGVIRMEGGFEIILCDFEAHLDAVDIMPVVESEGGWGGRRNEHAGRKNGLAGDLMGGWQYYKAIAQRYHGIGGKRVVLDYENFVSAFEYEGIDLFSNDVQSDTLMPRLQNVNESMIQEIRDAVTHLILKSNAESKESTNWQEVADMIITRYSVPLHYLSTSHDIRSSKEDFAAYLSVLLRPFIDHTSRNSTRETERCISQLVPPFPSPSPAPSPSLAHQAIHAITSQICTVLLSSLDITTSSISHSRSFTPPPTHALDLVDALVSYLQWTTWKECGTCADQQVCIVPIWPMGGFEDHETPRCKGPGDVIVGGYWGQRRGPPGKPPGEGEGPHGRGVDSEKRHGRGRGRKACGRHGHGHGGRGVLGAVRRVLGRIGGVLRLRGLAWRF